MPWLRFQWGGIAFTPAAYLGFSNALLVTTGDRNRWRGRAVMVSYVLGAVVLSAVAFSDLVVQGFALAPRAPHLLAGPLFLVFVVYYFAAVVWGAVNIIRARGRCLTSTSRRRMTYLAVTFAAPAVGIFPYLLFTGWPSALPGVILWLLSVMGNVGVSLTLLLLAYSVAFIGALTPDRVVKHRLVRFLLRGPLLAMLVVLVIIAASEAEGWLGLPERRLTLFGAVAIILVLQLAIEIAKPLIDRALYRQDQPEIEWIQEMGNRLLTTTDLRQFLENVLAALCDLLRVDTAFVAAIDGGRPHLEVVCGSLEPNTAEHLPREAWLAGPHADSRDEKGPQPPSQQRRIERQGGLFVWNGFWLVPLHTKARDAVLGVVGMRARNATLDLNPDEREGMEALLVQAAAALEDRQLQQSLFGALERIIPEIEDIQRRRGVFRYVGDEAVSGFNVTEAGEFGTWVRDALSHFWGGPKLADSPLLSLRVVERAARDRDGDPLKGLRAVLKQAIERLRPDGQRRMTAPEWILYNILELKFLQGRRVREIALRLVMSESDLYRKQRAAIEAVAQVVTEMEREESANGR
ncbi:MAG: hypothetical protein E3J64_08390 [Anaerolineales bacterium]|nr:MAG: hypothetical protein E3J64_08390 [Anaerolineales bacterium]